MQPQNINNSNSREIQAAMNTYSLLQQNGQSQTQSQPHFDPTSANDDFLEQILSSTTAAAAAFPWELPSDDQAAPPSSLLGGLDDLLAAKLRHQQISGGAAKALMLQQQLMMTRGLTGNGLRSPPPAGGGGLMASLGNGDMNNTDHGPTFKSSNMANDASVQALFNGFSGSIGLASNQPQNFHHTQGGALQAQNFGNEAAPPMNQAAASVPGGGGTAAQPRQRVRARRGQATDPHSIAERLRRERIAERMKALQELVPNANKTDKASMLDEIIDYVKFLQLQVKVLSMSRLGGATARAPFLADTSSEGKNNNGTQTASSSNNDGMSMAEHQVAKLMEEDMGSAMQYLQGKGLCLMPISLATAISTSTGHSRNPLSISNSFNNNNNSVLNGETSGSSSPNMSVLTNQSATMIGNVNGEASFKDATTFSKA